MSWTHWPDASWAEDIAQAAEHVGLFVFALPEREGVVTLAPHDRGEPPYPSGHPHPWDRANAWRTQDKRWVAALYDAREPTPNAVATKIHDELEEMVAWVRDTWAARQALAALLPDGEDAA